MQNFDHYQLKKLIKRNGLKAVYQAIDLNNAENVAVKTWKIIEDDSGYRPDIERFMRIMKAFVTFDHPQILPILNFGEMHRMEKGTAGNYLYAAMPRYTEPTLDRWIQETQATEPLPLTSIAHIVIGIANTLQEVHNKKLMHLGLKPSNVLVIENEEEGGMPEFILTGFEGASFANEPKNSYMEADTLHYIAPEQWEGKTVSASDQYALAMIAYELLAGEKVTEYENKQEPPYKQPKALKLASLSRRNARLVPAVDEVIIKGLARSPEERYTSISEFAVNLQRVLQLSERRNADVSANTGSGKGATTKNNSTHILLGITETEAQQGTTFPIVLAAGQRVSVNIPGGSYAGQTIRVAMGDANNTASMLVITLAVRPDPLAGIAEGINNSNQQIIEHLNQLTGDITTIVQKPGKAGAGESDPLMLQRLALISSKMDELVNSESSSISGVGDIPGYLNKRKGPIIMCVVLLLAMFMCNNQLLGNLRGAVVENGNGNIHAIMTSSAKIVASATAQHNADIVSTAVARVTATAVQENNIAQEASDTHIPKAYGIVSDSTHNYNSLGTLVLADLSNKTSAAQWNQQNVDSTHECFFGSSDNYYHAEMTAPTKPTTMCATSGNGGSLSTGAQFVLQAQVGIVNGDEGGIAFNINNGGYYYFDILQNGQYNIGSNGTPFTDGVGKTDTFMKGISSSRFNLLGIVGNHGTLTYYINLQKVFTVSGVSYGDSGALAAIANDTNDSTSVQFQNLRLWNY